MKTPFTLETARENTIKVFDMPDGVSIGITYATAPTVTMSGALLTREEAEKVHKALGTAIAGLRAREAKP